MPCALRSSIPGWSRGVMLTSLSLGLFACGASDNVRSVRPDPPDAVEVASDINACPTFSFYLVVPQAIRDGEIAIATVRATDSDSNDAELTYAWSASSGDFSEPGAGFTEYRCAAAGDQMLSVTATDPQGCERDLHFGVTCLEQTEK